MQRRIDTVTDDAPVVEGADEEVARWHRRFAVELFNRSWDLLEQADRSPDEDAEMLAAAFASAYHWGVVGTAENRALGDHQIAKVASHVGQPALALHYARRALEAIEIGRFGDWQVAAAYEGMAGMHHLSPVQLVITTGQRPCIRLVLLQPC